MRHGVGIRMFVSTGVVGLLAAGALACGEQKVDASKAETLIQNNLSGGPANVTCPKNVTYKKGGTFTCDANVTTYGQSSTSGTSVGSKNYTVTVHMVGDGKIEVGPSDLHEQ